MPTPNISRQIAELHDAFFEDRDQELVDYLKAESDADARREVESLQVKAGIHEPASLAELQRVGVTSASITAFMLLPLIRLAWADSKLQEGEFEYLLKAAESDGIQYGSPAYRLFNRWLEEKPTDRMIAAWRDYAQALSRELDEEPLAAMRQAVLERTRRVAQASGGILGFGDRISENERRVLNDIASALTKNAEKP
jgi:hypothetical protein